MRVSRGYLRSAAFMWRIDLHKLATRTCANNALVLNSSSEFHAIETSVRNNLEKSHYKFTSRIERERERRAVFIRINKLI